MASTYSPNLRLELIGTGEQQGTWGATTNVNIGTLIEEAIGGYTSVTVSDVIDTTLTTNNGSADQSRNMVINLTGTISAPRTVICPAVEKLYVVKNATSGGFAVTFKVSGQTGVSVPNGATVFLYVDGTDVRTITGSAASRDIGTSGATVPLLNGANTWSASQAFSSTNYFNAPQVIETSNTFPALRITQTGTGNALVVEDSANPDSTPFVVDASGSVGIGQSPVSNRKLTVATDRTVISYGTVLSTYSAGVFENDIITGFDGTSGFIGNFQNYRFDLLTNATPRLTISNGGNVGIGTTAPSTNLHVVGTDNNSSFLTSGTSKALRVTPTPTHVQLEGTDHTGIGSYQPLVIGGSVVQFQIGGSEAMRIDASGNVGIGTTNPAVPLDVVSAGIRLNTSAQISTNSNSGVLVLWGGAAGDGANIELCGSTSADPNAAYFDASTHFFRNANATSERLRINSSGALGFGGANFGTSGQALISGGSAATPSWGTLGVAGGGTGATSEAGARTNLGLVIGTNVQAYDATLQSISALGTAADRYAYTTGVNTWSEGTITAAGRAILDDADAAAQRTTLGLAIGTNVQAYDATLQSISALGTAADRYAYTTGVNTWTEGTITAAGRAILDDADAAAQRTTLGLAIGTNVQAYDATLQSLSGLGTAANRYAYTTGIDTWAEGTITAAGRAILDDADASAQRTTLGLGSAATLNAGTAANNVVQLDGTAKLPAVDGSQLTNLPATFSMPSGSVMPYAGATEPSGWLFCYGQAISRTTYAALFAVLGTTYGIGDGSTTFNIPDIRGRVIAGQDDMGGTSANRLTNQSGGVDGDVLGAAGGAETHTLTTAQMPAHTHTVTTASSSGGSTSGLQTTNQGTSSGSSTSSSAGSGGAHNNVQPTLILNYIIKT